MNKVVIYTRVSTEDQAREGYSLQAQENTLREYAKINQYDVINVYSDEGISGKSIKKRKALLQLLDDAKENKFDLVLIYKLDRLSRSVKDSYLIIDELVKNNIGLISYMDKHINLSTAQQRAMFGMSMVFAQLEVEQTAERVSFGMNQGFKNGKYMFGRLPYGYKIENEMIEIDEEQANVVRKIYDMYLQGLGQTKIAVELNNENIPSPTKSFWQQTVIRDILTNKGYYGVCEIDFKKIKKKEVIENFFPSIITKELYDEVQNLKMKKSKLHPRTSNLSVEEIPIMTGVIYCACCKKTIISKGVAYGKRRYICNSARFGKCNSKSFLEEKLEFMLINYLKNIKSIYANEIEIEFTNKKDNHINQLKRELLAVKKRIEKNYYAWENELIDDEFYKIRSKELKEKETDIMSQLNELEADTNTTPKIINIDIDIERLWCGLSKVNKKKFILEYIERISIESTENNFRVVEVFFK